MNNKIDIIIPSIPKDIDVLFSNMELFFQFIPADTLVLIGPESLENIIPEDERLKFIDENRLIDKKIIKDAISKKNNGKKLQKDRTGWYAQQFIKMAYSQITDNDFYLLWDSDTVPVKKLNLFDENGRPYFDTKTEYHKPYFDTILSLIPNLTRKIERSFIAEHMLINTYYMRSLINEIERNSRLEGTHFTEKIINAISNDNITNSGFSEFETYGTYILSRYPASYSIRKWDSFRFGGYFFQHKLRKCDVGWLASKYDAVSLEKIHSKSWLFLIVNSSLFQKLFSVKVLELLSIPLRIISKITKNR